MSAKSIRNAPKRRTPPTPTVIHQKVIDPQVLLLRQRFKEYKERRQVTGAKVEAYIQAQLAGRQQLRAQDFSIETIEDYICFSYVRHMASLGAKGKHVIGKYHLEFADAYVNVADMVECRDFTLSRAPDYSASA